MKDEGSFKWGEFVAIAEKLRQQRLFEWRAQKHMNIRKVDDEKRSKDGLYSQRDMWALVPGYKALLEHKRKQPPSIEMINAIVDYLECSLAEHNMLRLAAGRESLYLDPQGENLLAHISALRGTLRMLPFPAYIVSRDWFIYAANQYMLRFLDLTEQNIHDIPQEFCNILHFIFNPQLKVYQRLTGGRGGWDAIAKRNVYGFKLNNAQTLHDERVVKLIESLKAIPNSKFQSIWEAAEAKPHTKSPFYEADYVTEMVYQRDLTSVIRFRSLHISYGDVVFPGIVAYTPADTDTERIFGLLKLPIFPSEVPDVITSVGQSIIRKGY